MPKLSFQVLLIALVLSTTVEASAGSWVPIAGLPEDPVPVTLADPAFHQVRLPAGSLQGRWVRITGRVQGPPGQVRATILSLANGRRVSFSPPSICHGTAEDRVCGAEAWVPPGADEVKATFWTEAIPAKLSNTRYEQGMGGKADPAAAARLDVLLKEIADIYYRSSEVDWPALRAAFAPALAAPEGIDPVPGIVRALVTGLPGGRHNGLVRKVMPVESGVEPVTAAVGALMPSCRALGGDVHILELPGNQRLSPKLDRQYVSSAQQCLLAQPPSARWIIDLRSCSGGSSDLAIAALAPLFAAGELFKWVNGSGQQFPVEIGATGLKTGGLLTYENALPVGVLQATPAIIWIGPGCASACEALAAALSVRPRTRLVGEPTAGLATGNETVDVPPDHELHLTAGRLLAGGRLLDNDRLEPATVEPNLTESDVAAMFGLW